MAPEGSERETVLSVMGQAGDCKCERGWEEVSESVLSMMFRAKVACLFARLLVACCLQADNYSNYRQYTNPYAVNMKRQLLKKLVSFLVTKGRVQRGSDKQDSGTQRISQATLEVPNSIGKDGRIGLLGYICAFRRVSYLKRVACEAIHMVDLSSPPPIVRSGWRRANEPRHT